MSKKFTVEQILARAKSLQIVLRVQDGRLQIEAPKGAVTPKVLEVLQEYKAELIEALTLPPIKEECEVCGLPILDDPDIIFYFDGDGIPYCAEHWPWYQDDTKPASPDTEMSEEAEADIASPPSEDGVIPIANKQQQVQVRQDPFVQRAATMFGPLKKEPHVYLAGTFTIQDAAHETEQEIRAKNIAERERIMGAQQKVTAA